VLTHSVSVIEGTNVNIDASPREQTSGQPPFLGSSPSTLPPDILIIGAGALGLSTALALLERGRAVTVLERGEPGRESSWAGGGILFPLLPWHYGAALDRLVALSLALYPDWIARLRALGGPDPEYRVSGMLALAQDADDPLPAAGSAWAETHGMHAERTDAGRFLPRLADTPALWLPEVAQARNPRLVASLRTAVEKLGGRIAAHAEVRALQVAHGRVSRVVTDRETHVADQVVMCAGAWSAGLAGALAPGWKIAPVRGQMLLYKLAPGRLGPIVLREGRYLIPRADGHLLAGSTLEDAGFDKSVTPEARAELHAFASGILPELGDTQPAMHWSGLRPGSPDNIPSIGRHPRIANLWANTGHFRYGVTLAPASAALLAALMDGVPPPLDPAPYAWLD
jgi:glycine oxidase